MENGIMKTDLFKALAVSWALRAMGKSSHAGFETCMRNVRDIAPDIIWNKYNLGHVTLHAHENLERFIRDISNELPPEIREMIGGDMPSIERIEEAIREM